MRQLLSLILVLLDVLACVQNHVIPETLVGVKEVVAQIDSAITDSPGWEPADSTYKQARKTWTTFKQLIDADKYERALDFYMAEDSTGQNAGDFLVYLRHSSQRYAFYTDVLRPLMQEYKGANYALEDYVNNLKLEKAMEDTAIALSANTNGYVPEVYPCVVWDLCLGLAIMGEVDDAEELANDMSKGVYGLTNDILLSNFVATQLITQVLIYTNKPNEAKNTWTVFRNFLLENKTDYEEADLAQCLAAIDDALKDLEMDSSKL